MLTRTLTYLKFPSTTVGKERDVVVLLPAKYRPDKKYPVLYLFHGFARDHTMWPELAKYTMGAGKAEGRENTAVAGFSIEGRLALYAGFTMQETFGYIGAFCPAPGVFAYENICSMSESGLFKEDELRLQERFADNTYVVIVAGKDDDAVLNSPDRYHTALKENGCKHIWYKITGGHWFVQVGKRAIYNFLQDVFKA